MPPPPFGPGDHAAQKPPSEVNRFWRRQMWDTELHRLYSHLTEVTHSTDTHQNPLYLQNTFHDQARDRAAQLHQKHLAKENINLFRRLMAVHTRRPREFLTHHVQNPKTHSRYLEHKRVKDDNQRLVQRLVQSKTFVNERGSWDEHAQEHEEMLIRLSHNPKSCFIPGLAAKRKADQASMRTASIAEQAQAKIASPRVPLQKAMERAARIEAGEIAFDPETDDRSSWTQTPSGSGFGSGPHSSRSPSRGSAARHARSRTGGNGGPLYSYPLPPCSLPVDPTDPESARALSRASPQLHSSRGAPPPVLLPYGTHLVAPAVLDQTQYDAIHARLQEAAAASSTGPAAGPMTAEELGEDTAAAAAARSFASAMAEGHIQHTMLALPFPAPAPLDDGSAEPQVEVFFLQPHAHRAASPAPGSDAEANTGETTDAAAPTAAATVKSMVREAHAIPYPFQLPPLDLPEGSPAALAAQAQREAAIAAARRGSQQQLLQEEKEETHDSTDDLHRHYSRPSSRPSGSPPQSHSRAPSGSVSFEPQPPAVARAASSSSAASSSRGSRRVQLPAVSSAASAAATAVVPAFPAAAAATHSVVTPWVHYATARPSVYAHSTSALKGARVGASNSMATSGGGVRPFAPGSQRRTQKEAIEALIDLAYMPEEQSSSGDGSSSLNKTQKRSQPRSRPSPAIPAAAALAETHAAADSRPEESKQSEDS